MSTPLADIVADVRLLSGLRENQLYTDTQIISLVSDLWLELYDRFVTTNQHYRIKEFDFTLTGGVGSNSVDLPSDFQLGNGLEMNPMNPRPLSVRYLDNWLNRNNLGASVLDIGAGLTASDRQYCFTDASIKVFPAANSSGDYRLYYTPMAEKLLAPITVDFEIDAADNPSVPPTGLLPGTGSWSLTNSELNTDIPTDETVGVTLTLDAPNASFSGTYYILDIGLPPAFTLPTFSTNELASLFGYTGPPAGSGTYTYQPIGTVSELPDYADPWAIYIKLGTSIAIREARGQEMNDLERRFNSQKLRVDTLLQNRQEEPTQPPLTQGRGFWDSL